eukprot:g1555.t1
MAETIKSSSPTTGGEGASHRACGHLDSAGSTKASAATVPSTANDADMPAKAPAADGRTGSQKVWLGVGVVVWYTLSIGFNITNKKALNAIALPWSISVLQLVFGFIFVLPLWILKLRDAPGLTMANVKALSPIAACHTLSSVCAVIGLGAGAVSFVHIFKATEPLFTALFRQKALNAIALPWSISVLQIVVGFIFVLPLWILKLRDAPGLTMANVKALSPIAACHTLSSVCAVIGLGAGAVSFVHIFKATEPLFTALFRQVLSIVLRIDEHYIREFTGCTSRAVFMKQIFSPLVYVTLVLVVVGVSMASLKKLDFNWLAFGGAVGSTLAASGRAILSKRLMGMDMGQNMSPANLYAVVHIMTAAMLLPLAFAVESPRIEVLWYATVTSQERGEAIIYNTVASAVFFYLYNEVAFRYLGRVHPVTHAVGSAFKRVFLIAVSLVVFQSRLTPFAAVGCYMAMAGVLLYSLAKK